MIIWDWLLVSLYQNHNFENFVANRHFQAVEQSETAPPCSWSSIACTHLLSLVTRCKQRNLQPQFEAMARDGLPFVWVPGDARIADALGNVSSNPTLSKAHEISSQTLESRHITSHTHAPLTQREADTATPPRLPPMHCLSQRHRAIITSPNARL